MTEIRHPYTKRRCTEAGCVNLVAFTTYTGEWTHYYDHGVCALHMMSKHPEKYQQFKCKYSTDDFPHLCEECTTHRCEVKRCYEFIDTLEDKYCHRHKSIKTIDECHYCSSDEITYWRYYKIMICDDQNCHLSAQLGR